MLLNLYFRRGVCHKFLTGQKRNLPHCCNAFVVRTIGTIMMKLNSIYMNNAGELLYGTLNCVHDLLLARLPKERQITSLITEKEMNSALPPC